MATVYGIDLGTTYSCIAKIDTENVYGRPDVIIRNTSCAFPSVVYFDPNSGAPTVGDVAKERMRLPRFAGQTLAFFKRHIGLRDYCPDQITLNGNNREVSPIEGSACILHYLYKLADMEERGLGHIPTNQAVITIPAGFNNKQRMCTKIAAELAGINVLALIHEPTAAAISYDIQPEETILVFDLGGGTLDVSIVKKQQEGTYRVLASASDYDVFNRYIGGKEWDEALVNIAVELRNNSRNLERFERNSDNRAQEGRLRMEAERVKVELSDLEIVDFAFPDMESVPIKRCSFERRTYKLVKDCMRVVDSALEQLDGAVNINRCVLAGGASNMPMIKTHLLRRLAPIVANGRNENEWLCVTRPNRAIAEGAAIYARQISLEEANDTGIIIEERSSHSYGTSIGDERIGILIRSTDPMVYEGERVFRPKRDNQETVPVDVFECNRDEDGIPKKEGTLILNRSYLFPQEITVTKNTDVKFRVRRDRNGIIRITVNCEGGIPEEYTAPTIITEDVEAQIINSLALMDNTRR